MARKFRFRLETVQRVRRRERDVHQCTVADQTRAVQSLREKLSILAGRLHDHTGGARAARGVGRLDVSLLRGQQLYRGWLRHSVETTRGVLSREEVELAARQERLVEASRRLKVIEKLRERAWDRYRAGVSREEQQEMDDAARQMLFRRTTTTARRSFR